MQRESQTSTGEAGPMSRGRVRGRPEISDFSALLLMARLERIYRASGNPRGVKALAREVVERVSVVGASPDAAADRLRRKYRLVLRQEPEFSPLLSSANTPQPVHHCTGEVEKISVEICLGHEIDGADVCAGEPVVAATGPERTHRVTARIVERPRHVRRHGGPRHVLTFRISFSRSELVEFRLKPTMARELASVLSRALADLDRRQCVSVDRDEANVDAG